MSDDNKPQLRVNEYTYSNNRAPEPQSIQRNGVTTHIPNLKSLQDIVDGIKQSQFICSVPRAALVDEQSSQYTFLAVSGVKAHDRSVHKSNMETWLTVERMLKIRRDGFSFTAAYEDCRMIFTIIDDYITVVGRNADRIINLPPSMIQELLELDSLASEVWPFVNTGRDESWRDDVFRRLSEATSFVPKPIPINQSAVTPYESMRGFFEHLRDR